MTIRLALVLAATAVLPAIAVAQDQPAAAKEAAVTPAGDGLAKSCAARKFETVVEITMKSGVTRGKKVTLCGKEGQTDAEWARTLKDAAAKVEADAKMAPAVKAQITTALGLEIAKVEAAAAPAPSASIETVTLAAPIKAPEPAVNLRSGYTVLPPLPPPLKVASKTSPQAANSVPALPKPRLTVRCSVLGERGQGLPCAFIERDTVLTIRADEPLAAGRILRFVRKGDVRGEIALDAMREGQVRRAKVPTRLCTGTLYGKAEIQVVGAAKGGSAQVLDTLGPFALRCGA